MKCTRVLTILAGSLVAVASATALVAPSAHAAGGRHGSEGVLLEAQIFANFRSPTAVERAARSGIPLNVKEALVRVKAGKISTSDRALLATKPEYTQLADTLSQQITVGQWNSEVRAIGAPPTGAITAATYCRGFAGWVDSKSWISGASLFQWAQRLDVCYNGSAVTSLNSRYHTVSHRDWAWKDQGLVSDSAGTTGGWQYQSYMRGHMEMCVIKFGCTTDQYPWVRIIAYGNGTASITSGK
jgi:hypothetical protein